jgi:hypothetical protein
MLACRLSSLSNSSQGIRRSWLQGELRKIRPSIAVLSVGLAQAQAS